MQSFSTKTSKEKSNIFSSETQMNYFISLKKFGFFSGLKSMCYYLHFLHVCLCARQIFSGILNVHHALGRLLAGALNTEQSQSWKESMFKWCRIKVIIVTVTTINICFNLILTERPFCESSTRTVVKRMKPGNLMAALTFV